MSDRIEVRVPGVVFYDMLDPNITQVPREYGWPDPERRKVGRGTQFVYRLTRQQVHEMAEHLDDLAESRFFGDPEDRRYGYAARKVVDRLMAALGF